MSQRAAFLHGLWFKFLIEFLPWHKLPTSPKSFLVSVCHSNRMELEHHYFPTKVPKDPFESHAISKSSGVHDEHRLNPKAPTSASRELMSVPTLDSNPSSLYPTLLGFICLVYLWTTPSSMLAGMSCPLCSVPHLCLANYSVVLTSN